MLCVWGFCMRGGFWCLMLGDWDVNDEGFVN